MNINMINANVDEVTVAIGDRVLYRDKHNEVKEVRDVRDLCSTKKRLSGTSQSQGIEF